MLYNLEKKEKGVIDAKVKFDSAEWEDALNKAYEQNKGKFNIPGFRKGHAPRNIIEKTYGPGAFMNEALDGIYYTAYTSILKDNEDIQPIDRMHCHVTFLFEHHESIPYWTYLLNVNKHNLFCPQYLYLIF